MRVELVEVWVNSAYRWTGERWVRSHPDEDDGEAPVLVESTPQVGAHGRVCWSVYVSGVDLLPPRKFYVEYRPTGPLENFLTEMRAQLQLENPLVQDRIHIKGVWHV